MAACQPNVLSNASRGVTLGVKPDHIAKCKTSAVGIAECERIARSSPDGSSKILQNPHPPDSPRSTCYMSSRQDYRLGSSMLAAPAHANAGSVRSGSSCPARWLDNAGWHATE